MRRFFAPASKGEDPGFAGTLRLFVALLILMAALLAWFSPLLLLTGDGPWGPRLVAAAGVVPIVLVGGLLLYLAAGALGAEHPSRPRRYLANALMFVGFGPWLLLALIATLAKEIGRDLSGPMGGPGAPTGAPPAPESNAPPSRKTPSFGIG